MTAALETGKPLPDYIEPVGVGLPGQLLLRRPDVRVAERQVNAQAALLGASKTDWLPSFFLNGSFGYASHDMKDFTKRSSITWSIAPSMSWTIFNGGQRANNVRLQRAQLDETINQFNTTVLTAVQEVDNAMSSYKNSIKQIVACRETVSYTHLIFVSDAIFLVFVGTDFQLGTVGSQSASQCGRYTWSQIAADNGSAHQTDLRFFFFKQIHQDRSVGQ